MQVLNGDIDEAICSHAIYYSLWKRYDALPERYNWHLKWAKSFFGYLQWTFLFSLFLMNPFSLFYMPKCHYVIGKRGKCLNFRTPDVYFYPLRPELAESTYMLYRATQNPFYLRVGLDILRSLNTFARVKCGYATVHNVIDKSLEDRMESFFLSETSKYLYLVSLFILKCIH